MGKARVHGWDMKRPKCRLILSANSMFEFDGEYKTRMDFTKLTNQKVQALLQMQVLLLALEKEIASHTPHSKLFYDMYVTSYFFLASLASSF